MPFRGAPELDASVQAGDEQLRLSASLSISEHPGYLDERVDDLSTATQTASGPWQSREKRVAWLPESEPVPLHSEIGCGGSRAADRAGGGLLRQHRIVPETD